MSSPIARLRAPATAALAQISPFTAEDVELFAILAQVTLRRLKCLPPHRRNQALQASALLVISTGSIPAPAHAAPAAVQVAALYDDAAPRDARRREATIPPAPIQG